MNELREKPKNSTRLRSRGGCTQTINNFFNFIYQWIHISAMESRALCVVLNRFKCLNSTEIRLLLAVEHTEEEKKVLNVHERAIESKRGSFMLTFISCCTFYSHKKKFLLVEWELQTHSLNESKIKIAKLHESMNVKAIEKCEIMKSIAWRHQQQSTRRKMWNMKSIATAISTFDRLLQTSLLSLPFFRSSISHRQHPPKASSSKIRYRINRKTTTAGIAKSVSSWAQTQYNIGRFIIDQMHLSALNGEVNITEEWNEGKK